MDLHRMARGNRVNELLAALKSGAEVNKKDEFGATPLHYAISEGSVETAMALLSHAADVTVGDGGGKTALHYAVEHKLPSLAEAILRTDPAVVDSADNHGNRPLWAAAFNARGDYDLVKLLLRYGADASHKNNVGRTAVDLASRIGDRTLTQLLGGAG
jgi:ankyrin repeat protein